MTTWKCGHARRAIHKSFGKYADSVIEYGSRHAVTITWRRMFADELEQRGLDCPPCLASKRRERRHWVLFALAAFVLLGLVCFATCTARAASCSPYSPVDGRTCEPPTVLRSWHGKPVCVCRLPEVARAAQ